MKTHYALGAVLIGCLAFATAARASDARVRFDVHFGIPVHAPVVVHPYLVYPPVVYYGHPGYHHGHHSYRHHKKRHHEYRHHEKRHHSGSHWRHYDGHRGGHGYASAASRSRHQGGHGWHGR